MTMETIIKKAVQGGYANSFKEQMKPDYAHVLDPLFWTALGKSCGWDMENNYTAEFGAINEPIAQAIRFHSVNLVEGWSKAVEYLSELTK